MNLPSTTHLVLIPSYNTGRMVCETVAAARCRWNPVWVVDGSTGDNLLLTWMRTRLFLSFLFWLPFLLVRRMARQRRVCRN